MAAGSQGSSSSEVGGSVADRAAHVVTVISPEGATDLSLPSDSDSTSHAAASPGYRPPTDPPQSSDGSGSPPNRVQTVEDILSKLGAGEPVAASDDRETNCTAKLEKLSLSTGTDTDSKALTVLCKVVPALFVFGGMDTQETVHGDAFIFVP